MTLKDVLAKGLPVTEEEYQRRLELAFALGYNEHLEHTFRDQGFNEWLSQKKEVTE